MLLKRWIWDQSVHKWVIKISILGTLDLPNYQTSSFKGAYLTITNCKLYMSEAYTYS